MRSQDPLTPTSLTPISRIFLAPFSRHKLYANEEMRRTKKNRPSSTRIRTEMDDFTEQPRTCGLCKQPGHNRSNCPNV
jgi:hypothetical protein